MDAEPHEAGSPSSWTERLLHEEPCLTADDVAAQAGTGIDDLRRLWRALGFPDSAGTAAFAPADVEAVGLVKSLVDRGVVDADTSVGLTRSLGSTMAKLADWQMSTLGPYLLDPDQVEAGPADRERLRDVNETFEKLLVYAWRRHLAAAISRADGFEDDEHSIVHATIGFVDMVAFTELSNGIEEHELAALVERFESRCSDIVAASNGRVVKTLGDSVLFLVAEASDAARVATTIVERVGGDSSLPDVHLGMASGAIAMRLGDVFGPAVNLASRLTGLAQRNRVLCDAATADMLRDVPTFACRALVPRQVRGFGQVQPYTLRRVRRG